MISMAKAKRQRTDQNIKTRHCVICGISLVGRHFNTKLCSKLCRRIWAAEYERQRPDREDRKREALKRAKRYRRENLELVRAKDRARRMVPGKHERLLEYARARYRRLNPTKIKSCKVCGTDFVAERNKLTCSKLCAKKRHSIYIKRWHLENYERTKKRRRETNRLWRANNREHVREKNREFAKKQHIILAAIRELGLIRTGEYKNDDT